APEAAPLARGVAPGARRPVGGPQVAGLGALANAVAAPLETAAGGAAVARRRVAIVALLARLEDVVAAAHEETDGVAGVAGGAVRGPVVTLLADVDPTVAAAGHMAVVAPVARIGVAVVAGFPVRDDAVAASGRGTVRIAAIAVDDVPVVTFLVALLDAVP